jgi:hypothetical protein
MHPYTKRSWLIQYQALTHLAFFFLNNKGAGYSSRASPTLVDTAHERNLTVFFFFLKDEKSDCNLLQARSHIITKKMQWSLLHASMKLQTVPLL